MRTLDSSDRFLFLGEKGRIILDYVKDRRFFVARVNGKLVDLRSVLEEEAQVELLGFDSPEGREVYWHTSSHILAQAVKELYPEAKLGYGPPIAEGFYYDFDLGGRTFSPEDLEKIETRMREIIKRDIPIERKVLRKCEAIELFRERGEDYKVETLEEMEEEEVSVYWQGDFVDLCRGPHLPSTGYVRYVKLLSSSSAYWKGDERNPILQRIYGISFPEKKMLDQYLFRLEEAKKRDHRKLGKELGLFSVSQAVGAGLILWHPKGAAIRRVIEEFWIDEHIKRGYELIYTPHIGRSELWKISGHLDFYRENMYAPMDIEGEEYFIKPMNCPFHMEIYKSRIRSYRDLPIRYAELGTVYRYEKSGVLHGLMRVRGFTQDDAHIFARPDQVEDEIRGVLSFTFYMLRSFGFEDFGIYISTRPEKYVGDEEMWELATASLIKAVKKMKLDYQIDEGGGAFYGPKIDVKIKDALGREWQCSTIQFDFNLPEKFNITYRDRDGADKKPYMIHRALLGSLERFFGVLIEHYAGNFPLWLAPVQVAVMNISEDNLEYAGKVYKTLFRKGFRAILDDRNEKIGYKIRDAENQKIPYMLIIGRREEEEGLVAVRRHGEGDIGKMTLADFTRLLRKEIRAKIKKEK